MTIMRMNSIKPAVGAKTKKVRVGRGIGSGLGKTCGRGHKGQRARAGGYHRVGFEGGQMPFQRRVPKMGFRSSQQLTHAEIRLSDLNSPLLGDLVSLAELRKAKIIGANIKTVKLIVSGTLKKAVTCIDIPMTKGANTQIIALGGQVRCSAADDSQG